MPKCQHIPALLWNQILLVDIPCLTTWEYGFPHRNITPTYSWHMSQYSTPLHSTPLHSMLGVRYPLSSYKGIWNSHVGTLPSTRFLAHGTVLWDSRKSSFPPSHKVTCVSRSMHCTREQRAHYLVHQLDSKTKLVTTLHITFLLMSCIGAR